MPDFKIINDKASDMLPSIQELRDSQRKGSTGSGMNDPNAKLNETQGHQVQIKS